jgi:AcrR family transcriptional regulator
VPQETRDKIVEAAYRTLVDLGYDQTSVKEIAGAAGVAPGLVHYYFGSKEDLVVAAIRFGCEEFEREQRLGPEQEARLALEASKRHARERTGFFRLFFDMCGVAMHNPAVAQAMRAFVAEDRQQVERLADDLLALRERDRGEAPAIAAAVWAGYFGVILQGLLDPGFEIDPPLDALGRMALEGA